jgi:hypothetical protein
MSINFSPNSPLSGRKAGNGVSVVLAVLVVQLLIYCTLFGRPSPAAAQGSEQDDCPAGQVRTPCGKCLPARGVRETDALRSARDALRRGATVGGGLYDYDLLEDGDLDSDSDSIGGGAAGAGSGSYRDRRRGQDEGYGGEPPGGGGHSDSPAIGEPAPPSVIASRIFAGPNQYPLHEFAAYGILAFQSRASPHDRHRHLMICEAYIASLPLFSEIGVHRSRQMATVWPIRKDEIAEDMNRMQGKNVCEIAVESYELVTALNSIRDARIAGADIPGSGPYLLAWFPPTDKGMKNALVLVSNLSDATTYDNAQSMLLQWTRDIQQDSSLWEKGWNVEKLRVRIRLWADKYGPKILSLFGVKV